MATYVYDKKTGKVVLEQERTDRDKPRGVYITKTFRPIKNRQLAPSIMAWRRNDPSCYYSSFKELEQKAKATGQVVNADNSDRKPQE